MISCDYAQHFVANDHRDTYPRRQCLPDVLCTCWLFVPIFRLFPSRDEERLPGTDDLFRTAFARLAGLPVGIIVYIDALTLDVGQAKPHSVCWLIIECHI